MKRRTPTARIALLGVGLSLLAGVARADCGDVTGDGTTTAGDALAVLRSAVGQSVDLTCTFDGLDPDATPNFGSTSLMGGFVPDPFTKNMTSGGSVPVTFLGGQCTGHVTEQPDFVLTYAAVGDPLLRFYFLGDDGGDTTLVIRGPDGYFRYCDDDSFATKHPTVDVTNPDSGEYAVWVGSYVAGENVEGTLFITELNGNHP